MSLPSPAELVELPFMRTALLELVLLALAGGVLGAWIVLRRLAFYSHAVGSATFPGLVLAHAIGFSPRLAALAVALGYAGGVERAGRGSRDPGDTATGLILVAALAAGVVLASDVFSSGAAVDRLLFGSLVALDDADVVASALAAALALGAAGVLGRAWTAAAFDPEGASALGLPLARADLALLMVIATATVAALPAVGALLVTALFVVPAATARLVARSVATLVGLSVALAGGQAVGGLYVALWLDTPPGPAVAVLGACVFGVTAMVTHARARTAPA